MIKYIFVGLTLILFGCTINAQEVKDKAYHVMLDKLLSHTVKEVSVDKAVTEGQNVQVLDAREIEEYKISKIRGATWIGYDDFNLKRVEGIDKKSTILIYCSVGYRSEKIAEKLRDAGYSNVSNLYGGIFEWVNQGYSIVDSNNTETKNVHAFDKNWGVWLTKGNKIY